MHHRFVGQTTGPTCIPPAKAPTFVLSEISQLPSLTVAQDDLSAKAIKVTVGRTRAPLGLLVELVSRSC